MTSSALSPPSRRVPGRWSLVGILALAALLRGAMIGRTELSYDEVFGALFAAQSLPDMLLAILRYEIHPPLWNLQLWAWAQLGDSAIWLRLNSSAWSILMIGLTWYFARDRLGERRALLAALVLALLPQAVVTGAELRMYPMIGALVVLSWLALHRLLESPSAPWADVGLVGAQVALAYTHGSGTLQVFLLGVYGLALLLRARPAPDRVRAWVKVEALTGVLVLPAVANALVRRVAHTKPVTAEQVLTDLAKLTFGRDWADPTWMVVVGSLLFFAILGAAARNPRLRPLVATYLGFGLLAIAVTSFVVKPIWYFRTLLPFLPAFALAWAELAVLGLDRLRRPLGAGAAAASVLLLAALTVRSLVVHVSPCDISRPVTYARAQLTPGDVIYSPLVFDAWSVAWHWTGGPWGSPLEFGDTDLPRTGKWRTLLGSLTPEARAKARLAPRTNRLPLGGTALYFGPGSRPALEALRPPRIHLIDSRTVPALSGPLELPGYRRAEERRYPDGVLYLRLEADTATRAAGSPLGGG